MNTFIVPAMALACQSRFGAADLASPALGAGADAEAEAEDAGADADVGAEAEGALVGVAEPPQLLAKSSNPDSVSAVCAIRRGRFTMLLQAEP
jgi:hypothetical protein